MNTQGSRGDSSAHLRCPMCGSAMNRHAEKLVFARESVESIESAEPGAGAHGFEDGGFVDEFHTCPHCRYVLERRAR